MLRKRIECPVLISGFIVLICCLKSGSAIMCHNCTSIMDSKCADPFDETSDEFLVNCTAWREDSTFCRKIDQTVKGINRVFRVCAWKEHEKYDCYMGAAEYYKSKICICKTDGCNHASSVIIPVNILLVASVLWILNSSRPESV